MVGKHGALLDLDLQGLQDIRGSVGGGATAPTLDVSKPSALRPAVDSLPNVMDGKAIKEARDHLSDHVILGVF